MNLTKRKNKTKDEIKNAFLTFFKAKDVKHLETQKLKEIKQRLNEYVREYDKLFKDLLIQIPCTIDEKMLVQWYQ